MKTWPLYDDMFYVKVIGIALLLWLIVGCDRVVVTQPPTGSTTAVPVPVATATLNSQYCPWGQAIMGCDH